jgi:hypothetical protein
MSTQRGEKGVPGQNFTKSDVEAGTHGRTEPTKTRLTWPLRKHSKTPINIFEVAVKKILTYFSLVCTEGEKGCTWPKFTKSDAGEGPAATQSRRCRATHEETHSRRNAFVYISRQ